MVFCEVFTRCRCGLQFSLDDNYVRMHSLQNTGFLPGIFSGGGKIYFYANFFCYANFSIVFKLNFRGGQTASGGSPRLPLYKKARIVYSFLNQFQFTQSLHLSPFPKSIFPLLTSFFLEHSIMIKFGACLIFYKFSPKSLKQPKPRVF